MSDDLSAQQPLASARNDRRAWRIFAAGMALYLATRLIALPNFPIYFFSDEAIQTLSAADLIQNGFRGPAGNLLPLFFALGAGDRFGIVHQGFTLGALGMDIYRFD